MPFQKRQAAKVSWEKSLRTYQNPTKKPFNSSVKKVLTTFEKVIKNPDPKPVPFDRKPKPLYEKIAEIKSQQLQPLLPPVLKATEPALDYSQDNIIKIVNTIQTTNRGELWSTAGVCHGLTLYWAIKGDEAYYKIAKKILTKTFDSAELKEFVTQVTCLQNSQVHKTQFQATLPDETLKFDHKLEVKPKAPTQNFPWDWDWLHNKFTIYRNNYETAMILTGDSATSAHSIGIRCSDNQYCLFDANSKDGFPKTFKCSFNILQPSKNYILNHVDAEEMINAIQHCLYDTFVATKKMTIPLHQLRLYINEFQNPVSSAATKQPTPTPHTYHSNQKTISALTVFVNQQRSPQRSPHYPPSVYTASSSKIR